MAVLEPHNGYYLWKYLPSTPAAAIFLLLFISTTTFHTWKMIKTKTWFCTVFVIGGFCTCALSFPFPHLRTPTDRNLVEVIGYIGRCIAHNNTGKLMPFILQNFFILLSPALFAASIYMVLGRIIRSVRGEAHSLISSRLVKEVFSLGGSITGLVPPSVEERLKRRLPKIS